MKPETHKILTAASLWAAIALPVFVSPVWAASGSEGVLPESVATATAAASEVAPESTDQLLTLRNTMLGMLSRLVEQGVLTQEEARSLVEQAEREAAVETAQNADLSKIGDDTVRVAYVPQVVKDEIRDQVMSQLKKEVVEDVINEAQDEAWGVPGALPAWISDIRWSADVRLRGQADLFDGGNSAGYLDFQAINQAGGLALAGQEGLLNTLEDRERLRSRMRLGLDMRINQNWRAGLRVTTSNDGNPVSRNATLGQSDGDFEANIDLAYLRYQSKHLLFTGGRMRNPYVATDMIWDRDLTFEGLAMTGLLPFDGRVGGQAFLTAGAFPLEEVEFASRDKWLYGGQAGVRFGFAGGGNLTLASGYYLFDNISGVRNTPESQLFDYTAPAFVQKGNTLFDIRNDTAAGTGLWALASDFELLSGTMMFDSGPVLSTGASRPVHLFLAGEYVENIGFDQDEIFERTGAVVRERNHGYTGSIGLGTPRMARAGDWRLDAYFRHLQRDAVVDGFTDSQFHLGGTDAEGWGLGFQFGLSRNTFLNFNYLTANEIDGEPLGVDVVQLDINTRF